MASAPTPAAPASSGISNNVVGLLCYLFGWLGGLIFLLIEPYKNDKTIRFHAFQSIFFAVALIGLYIAWFILGIILSVIHLSILLIPVWLILGLGVFAAWIFLMIKAYSNQIFKLPIIGELAAKQAGL
jgi:uncharacterized membrane protein